MKKNCIGKYHPSAKRLISLIAALTIIVSFTPIIANAETVGSGTCGAQDNNLIWTLDSDGTLTISGEGKMVNYNGFSAPWYRYYKDIKNVNIQTGVTSIGDSAFYSCRALTSINIPNSVTSIGNSAFWGCDVLANAELPNSVTSIGNEAFSRCDSLTNINIPNGVTSIGNSAFSGCSALTSINIPNGVTSIGKSAFYDCIALTSINIPNGVTNIGYNVFDWCAALTSIDVDEDNKYYSSADGVLFNKDMTELIRYPAGKKSSSYTIPNGVININENAFYSCVNLSDVTVPNTVANIENYAFSVYGGLSNINVDRDNKYYSSADGVLFNKDMTELICYPIGKNSSGYTIPTGITNIGSGAFASCTLSEVIIPGSVISISDWAFSGCNSLISIIIPDSVTDIGESAFRSCENLTSITIGNSVTSIGESAFSDCYDLTDVELSNSITSISDYAFQYCSSLTSITIPGSVTSIGNFAFEDCTALTNVELQNGLTSIGYLAFSGCDSLTSIIIPDSVTSIGMWTFLGCNSLTSIIIPDSVKSIGREVFYNTAYYNNTDNWDNGVLYINNALIQASRDELPESYIIKDGTTVIADFAFSGYYGLTNIELPNSLTSIGNEAFSGCEGLTSITIPSSVANIGEGVFSGCRNLTNINVNEGNKYYLSDDNVLFTKDKTMLVCYCKDEENYIIPSGVTNICDSAFEDCGALTSVTIPDSVTSIGNNAFSWCERLANINIPNNVTSIGGSAFDSTAYYNNTDNWDNGVLYINNALIQANRNKLPESYIIKDGTTVIAENAFYECDRLASINIPNSVTSIGNGAFSGCRALTSINIPNGVTTIGDFTFENCNSLTSVKLPSSITSIGYFAFDWCESLTDVYYSGTEEQWKAIKTSSNNNSLLIANIHYNYTSMPAEVKSVTQIGSPENGVYSFSTEYKSEENGILVAVLYKDGTISGYTTINISPSFSSKSLSINTTDGADSAKFFIWDSLSNMQPQSYVYDINL